MLLGVPDTTSAFPGVDQLGAGCRIDPTVSVMRFGERSDVVQLADAVSLYAQTRLVLGDVTADPCVGIRIGARTIVNVGAYLSCEGGLEIDFEAHTVLVDGQDAGLTATEHKILKELVASKGRVLPRERLLDTVWDTDFEGTSRTVDTHMRRLRGKLGPYADWVETVRGVGYRFKPVVKPEA